MRTYNDITYYSVLEAASALGYSTVRIRQLIHKRTLLGAVRGEQRTLWIPEEAVLDFLKNTPTRKHAKPLAKEKKCS